MGLDRVRTIAMSDTAGLSRGETATATGAPITVPVGTAALGRLFNVLGEAIDGKGAIPASEPHLPIHRMPPSFDEQTTKVEVFETGIKAIDLIIPLHQGRQGRALRRRRRGQDRHHPGAYPQRGAGARAATRSSPAWASACARGNDLYHEMEESGVLDKTALVFGQMNEVPGARARVALTGLTQAEYFRDEGGKDVLFFMDNVFRFIQAGSEVSSLLGRVPSAVGYQPTLAEEMGKLQERITSTKKGSITSIQAVYVPADDLTDPAPATTFAHLDGTVVLSRQLASLGIYPAIPRPRSRRPWWARSTTASPTR